MVSKLAALARMVLLAALLALEELNIGWVEGVARMGGWVGWEGGVFEQTSMNMLILRKFAR